MTIAAFLQLYSLPVIVTGPALLRRLTRTGHAPGLGVAALLTAITTVLISRCDQRRGCAAQGPRPGEGD